MPVSDTSAPIRPGRGPSWLWLVPIAAALFGVFLIVQARQSAGPVVTLSFKTAAGLEVGKTPVKYKDVTIGTVDTIVLSDDGSHVVASVGLLRSAAGIATADTRFWVVRPRLGFQGVSGIDTLLSGAYIAVDKGASTEPAHDFTGLESPPAVIGGAAGTTVVLVADDLGSLYIGSPLYFRRIEVGHVTSYELSDDGKHVNVHAFVDAPYDRFVTAGTRFWNASGVDISLDANGLKLDTQSLATLVAGGIAFATPAGAPTLPLMDTYDLAKNREAAMAPPDGEARYIRLRFERSLHGLSVGAPVEFAGIDVGHVASIDLDYDPAKHQFVTLVGIDVYARRLGSVLDKLPKPDGDPVRSEAEFLKGMVDNGLRAQARSGNLLTGQLFVSLDFIPDAPKVVFDAHAVPTMLPVVNGGYDHLQDQVASIVDKIEKVPLDTIGKNLNHTLIDVDLVLKQVNGDVLPAATKTLAQTDDTLVSLRQFLAEDAPWQQGLGQTMQDVSRTARSVRALSDLLGRHPEALLRGVPGDTYPPSRSQSTQP